MAHSKVLLKKLKYLWEDGFANIQGKLVQIEFNEIFKVTDRN